MIILNARTSVIALAVLTVLASTTARATFGQESNVDAATVTIPSVKVKRIIVRRTRQVVMALKNQDMARLSAFVHPEKGVRFTPYNYVSVKNDLVFKRQAIPNQLRNSKKHVWGDYEGSGDPIRLTFRDYYKRFVYDHDFANMTGVSYDSFNTRGSADNPWEYYPGAIIVSYYYPGIEGPKGGVMDWKGLRLVFQKKGRAWFLVGILHDEWMI